MTGNATEPLVERPPGVPGSAVFDAAQDAWISAPTDLEGRRHGAHRIYRRDGTLLLASEYEAGVPVGTIVEYHPSGTVRSEGRYRDGKLDGVLAHYVSDEPGAKPLRSCCVPRGARELRLYYEAGAVRLERFFDGEGRAIAANGKPLPEIPPGVPPYADFDEASRRWVFREHQGPGNSIVRAFDGAGQLVEEVEMRGGRRRVTRSFVDGSLSEEKHLDDQGRLHGAYRRFYSSDSVYQDTEIREERGQFADGHLVGVWAFCDRVGTPRVTVDRGVLSRRGRFAELANEPVEAADGVRARIAERRRDGAVREALWLAARHHHRFPSDSPLTLLLSELEVPVGERQRAAWQRFLEGQLPQGRRLDIDSVLDALLSGARPAEVLRVLATLAPEGSPAALELVDGALEFEPENRRALANRAMLRLEVGDVEGAHADADAMVTLGEGAAAQQLRVTASAMFPRFEFTPGREPPTAPDAELPEVGVEQSLDAVRRIVATYATRIVVAREKLSHWAGVEATWLPPDTSALLLDGPVELRQLRVTIEDEAEDGTQERSEVDIDEAAGLDGSTVQSWLAVARADWDALCWLCWAVGSSRVVLPSALAPAADLAAAINDAMARCFRLHDLLRTGGLAAKARGAPDFDWAGLPATKLPRSLLHVAARQYLERRAMFFWLLFPQNVSPFQSDLRKP